MIDMVMVGRCQAFYEVSLIIIAETTTIRTACKGLFGYSF